MRTSLSGTMLLALGVLAAPAGAGEITLYDGALGTSPSQQGWFFRYLPPVPPIGEQVGGGLTTIDTTASSLIHAGYFTTDPLDPTQVDPAMPTLDRSLGYTVRLDLRLDQEDHGTRVDRAGLSVIVLGNDGKGIELGFWSNEVWAQSDNPLFTHAEGAAFDTSALTSYSLSIFGSSYTLSANGTQILTGALRDYSAFGAPYTTPNQIFVGDNTSSASARFGLARVSVLTPVPEPSSVTLLGIAAGIVLVATRRRRNGR